jgi:hypothetical protein
MGITITYPGGIPSSEKGTANGVATLDADSLHSVDEIREVICLPFSDYNITAITAATSLMSFVMPFNMVVTDVIATLDTAQTSGSIFTVDVNSNGSTLLSTKITIDNTEKTSETASTAPVISDSFIGEGEEVTIDVDQVGDGTAKGGKVYLKGHRSSGL